MGLAKAGVKLVGLKKAAGLGLAKAGVKLVGGKVALVKVKKAAPAIAVAGGLKLAGLGAAGLSMHLILILFYLDLARLNFNRFRS